MNKSTKEFLMRIADKVKDPSVKLHILCMNSLLEYDLAYLRKSKAVTTSFYSAISAAARVIRNYDYIKDVFDMMVEDIRYNNLFGWFSFPIEEIITILIKRDKDKYEEHILNKLFGDTWKDPDFFLPRNRFLGLSDRLPTLGNLLARNTTFSDNISKKLSKKIINGLKILYETIPILKEKNIEYYKDSLIFPECAVTKYIKRLLLNRRCDNQQPIFTLSGIGIYILTDREGVGKIRICKYLRTCLFKNSNPSKPLSEKIVKRFPKLSNNIVEHTTKKGVYLGIYKEEYINFPKDFSLSLD